MSSTNPAVWPGVAMAAGVGLLLAAPLVLWLTPAEAFWTDADQEQLQRASANLHAATYNHAEQKRSGNFHGRDGAPHDPVAAKAKLVARAGRIRSAAGPTGRLCARGKPG